MPIGYVNFETLDRNAVQRNLKVWSSDGTLGGDLIRLNILAKTDGTAVNPPAPGVAGTPSADVLTIQGASGGTPVPVTAPATQRTASAVRSTTSGNIATNSFSASVTNVGAANGTVAGITLAPGESISWQAPMGDTLAAITYDATGTTFLISRVF